MNCAPALTREFAVPCDERRVGSQSPNAAIGQPARLQQAVPRALQKKPRASWGGSGAGQIGALGRGGKSARHHTIKHDQRHIVPAPRANISSSVVTAPKRRVTAEGRLSHDDEARPLQVLDDPLGGDLRHVLVGLMHPLFAAIAKGESDCLGKVMRVGGRKLVVVGHGRL